MKTRGLALSGLVAMLACGGSLEEEQPSPPPSEQPPPALSPSAPDGCSLPSKEVVASTSAVVVRESASGCHIAIHEHSSTSTWTLVVIDSDGQRRQHLTDRLSAHPDGRSTGMFSWIGDTLLDIEDGNLVARDGGGRTAPRELARGVREYVASHDERFLVYEDIDEHGQGAAHAVSLDGKTRVDFEAFLGRRTGLDHVGFSDVITAGPPGSSVAIIPASGHCDHCDLTYQEHGCGPVEVIPLDPGPTRSLPGPAIVLDVHRPTGRMILDVWRADKTHAIHRADVATLDRPELLLERAATVTTTTTDSRETKCEGAHARLSPSGSRLALTPYSGRTFTQGDSGSSGEDATSTVFFDVAAAPPVRLREAVTKGLVVDVTDEHVVVRSAATSGRLHVDAESWSGDTRVLADLAGEWRWPFTQLGEGHWLAEPFASEEHAPVVLSLSGLRELEVKGNLNQLFDRWFTINQTENVTPTRAPDGYYDKIGPTHVYDRSTLSRTTIVPGDVYLARVVGGGKAIAIFTPRVPAATHQLALRPLP